jgi:hypothetical protein
VTKKTDRLTIRFQPEFIADLDKAAKAGGYASKVSFVRQACANQLEGASKALSDTEERILATLERQSRDIRKVTTTTVAIYAALDTFMKLYLTYTPEIPPETRAANVATGKLRYERFTRDVAKNLTGSVVAALRELVGSETESS